MNHQSQSRTVGSLLVALILAIAAPAFATTYEIQSDQSRVRFQISHNDYAKPVKGRFTQLAGRIDYDPTRSNGLAVEATIDADSVDTDNGYRDGHLKASFFEADRFPEIEFKIERIDPSNKTLVGELTMKGIRKQVELSTSNVREVVGKDGRRSLRYRATALINRRDFGVEENADRATGLGKLLAHVQEGLDEFIDDVVEVQISVVAREVKDMASVNDDAAPVN